MLMVGASRVATYQRPSPWRVDLRSLRRLGRVLGRRAAGWVMRSRHTPTEAAAGRWVGVPLTLARRARRPLRATRIRGSSERPPRVNRLAALSWAAVLLLGIAPA